MVNESVLMSVYEIEQCEDNLAHMMKSVNNFHEAITSSISIFNNNSVVQSFYESGNFGMDMQKELKDILEAVEDFANILNDNNGLIPATHEALDEQKKLLNSSYKGGN